MKEDDPEDPPDCLAAANDNDPVCDLPDIDVDAALTTIAQAIGRHIAREHIRACRGANDNELGAFAPPDEP